jgi:aldehyde:ferredoxin oxidoreductase
MGTCLFLFMSPLPKDPMTPLPFAASMMKAVTGWDRSLDELLEAGERIGTMRHVFTLREGINPRERFVHNRIIGKPPQKEGPLAGVSLDIEEETAWNLGALDWDRVTTKPSRKKLLKLGLDDIAQEFWPPPAAPGFGPSR